MTLVMLQIEFYQIGVSQHIQFQPTDFIYLGDTAIDMKTAVSAGMFPVGVLWGFRSLEELKENGARVVIDEPMQLMEFIKT